MVIFNIFSNDFEKEILNTFCHYTMTKSMDTYCNTQYIAHIINITTSHITVGMMHLPPTDHCNDIFEVAMDGSPMCKNKKTGSKMI